MRVAIAGAGIGGLTAALFLHAQGLEVTVHEAVPVLKELGVGINIQPHAVRELVKLDLLPRLEDTGNSCLAWAMYNRFGQTIWTEPRGVRAGHGWPQVSIGRGQLQGLLLQAVKERLPEGSVQTGQRLESFDQDDTGVTLRLRSADGSLSDVRADILVGADGIHSRVRRTLHPQESAEPVFSGMLLWRGVTEAPPYLDGHTMILAGYREQKFIAYPITRPRADGRATINWIAEIAADRMLRREDWNREGRLEDFLPHYADWKFPWLDVPELIRQASLVYEFPMVDRDPLPQWSFGRVTLLGDAAHPMYPIGANGASQAIRDASALADALTRFAADPIGALAAYEAERLDVTSKIVMSNRKLGPEQAMQVVHERSPNGFTRLEDVVSETELAAIARGYRDVTWAEKAATAG